MLSVRRNIARTLASIVCLVALATSAGEATASGPSPPSVMTRNLYIGADITPALSAIGRCPAVPPPQCQSLVLEAIAGVFTQVRATDFPARAQALAREIDDFDPYVIGLQEVALWRSGAIGNPAAATTIEYDFLATLLAALNARGLRYAAVSEQQEVDVEVPAGAPYFRDIRLSVRDVVLARTDLPRILFSVSNPLGANYSARISVPNPQGGTIALLRGWASVDIPILGRPAIRFVNTHVEALNDAVRQAQAAELVASAAMSSPWRSFLPGTSIPTRPAPRPAPTRSSRPQGSRIPATPRTLAATPPTCSTRRPRSRAGSTTSSSGRPSSPACSPRGSSVSIPPTAPPRLPACSGRPTTRAWSPGSGSAIESEAPQLGEEES